MKRRACLGYALLAVLLLPKAAFSTENITIVTGSPYATYYALAQDIARLASPSGMTVSVKESSGSVDNIRHIGMDANTLGIVQSDVLGFLNRSQNPESMKMAKQLRMVFPLHQEEVHLIARRDIRRFADLAGKRVIVGDEGSGSLITAVNLFAMSGVTPSQILKVAPAEAVVALLKNQADAMFFVGGKPVKLFKNMEALAADAETAPLLEGLHFVSLGDAEMLKEYSPAEITPDDYTFMDVPVSTIAVTALLVSLEPEGKKNKERCSIIGSVANSIRSQFAALRTQGHEKWKQVDIDRKEAIWKRDSCVSIPVTPVTATGVLEKDLLKVIKNR